MSQRRVLDDEGVACVFKDAHLLGVPHRFNRMQFHFIWYYTNSAVGMCRTFL